MPFTYEYPRHALTVDAIVFRNIGNETQVLLIQRAFAPFQGFWAFPGGFMEMYETAEHAVLRELKEETNLENIDFQQLLTVSTVDRDPRGRTVSIVFYGFLEDDAAMPVAGDDAGKVQWFEISNLPDLAFDHKEILEIAISKLSIS